MNLSSNLENKVPNEEENLIFKCGNCNSSYIHKENIFGFCNICVKNELISNIMATYLIFSTEAVQLYLNGKENHIPELLRSSKIIRIFFILKIFYLFSFNSEIHYCKKL